MIRKDFVSSFCSAAAVTVLLGMSAVANANPPAVRQTAEMVELQFLQPVGGGGTLERTRQAVWARISTSGLGVDAAYTVWWVIFNNPGHCASNPCSPADLANEAVDGAVFYADGFVTGLDGIANVTAHLETGSPPKGTDMLVPGQLHPGNGFGAEIHLVLRSHGPIATGSVGQQTTTFDPGCLICEDQQAIIFLPMAP